MPFRFPDGTADPRLPGPAPGPDTFPRHLSGSLDEVEPLDPAQVRRLRFGRPGRGDPGYDRDEVAAFLHRIADTLAGRDQLSAAEVRAARFHRAADARRAWSAREVDAFLARAEQALASGRVSPTRLRTGADLRAVRLPRAGHGYDPLEVDALLARAAATLDGRGTVTAFEVASTRFGTTSGLRRGYQVRAVDELLDELEQELRSRGR
ncbi:DivIVA domain-containing protein [Goodfellowiella coeruleoviolacea]|uniref:DivIVA domain-containing protein n=1 Tax=Goodfellowiella coeruleoviolacea TaxID=334858 RepID=UPI0020A3C2AD|nr:DivIVA domain-containing protein [Goodfellowiella coeruleoviolacea]